MLQGRLQHQVFRRITDNKQFAEENEVRALRSSLRARFPRQRDVADDIPERRVQLGKGNLESIGHRMSSLWRRRDALHHNN